MATLALASGDPGLAQEIATANANTMAAGILAPNGSGTEIYLASKLGKAGASVKRGLEALAKSPRVRDALGRFAPDPNNPRSPYRFTDAMRRAAWKRIYTERSFDLPDADYDAIKARGWRGPQQPNVWGEIETMELSHEPVPLRNGGTEVVPVWPAEHAARDPDRQLKKR